MTTLVYSTVVFIGALGFSSFSLAQNTDAGTQSQKTELHLTPSAASNFAQLALRCIQKEYPNKPDHVLNAPKDVKDPKYFHPAFYGCFDWHSCVHGHWMLVRLIKMFPNLPEASAIRGALNKDLTAVNIAAEVRYFGQPGRKSFERTYGWAWLLKFAQELHEWDDPDSHRWYANLKPLADVIVNHYEDFLPKQNYPIRTGVHPNTAFGIAFALDYARSVHDTRLDSLLVERSKSYYFSDKDCPISWEPGGEDFFSPCLEEADLMRRVLGSAEFEPWLRSFMPHLLDKDGAITFVPATVTDRTDPKLVHLDGLNLSRGWCMMGIASVLPQQDPLRHALIVSASQHAGSSLKYVASGNYEGEHWLASFAVYLLSSSLSQ
jgi:hypothetical protein